MIGARRAFVPMNWGVANIGGERRNGGATFTREDSQRNERKANNHRHFPARNIAKASVTRMERSAIRELSAVASSSAPDFAALHPGYG
jgi:hypothetical protein